MSQIFDNKIIPAILTVALLFFFLSPVEVAFNATIIMGVILFDRWKFQILMIAAAFYWYDVGPFEASRVESAVLQHGWQFRLIALITCIGVIAACLSIKRRLKYPVLTSVLLLSLVFFLGSMPFYNNDFAVLVQVFTIYFKFFFWYLVFLLIETEASLQANALFTLPFWSHISGYLPTATSPNLLMSQQAGEDRALRSCRWAAVRILSAAVILKYGSEVLEGLVFSGSGWDHLPSLGIAPMTSDFTIINSDQALLPLWEKWLALITHVLLRYMQLAVNFGIIVGQARSVGFMVPSMMNSPWQANSFGDLFSRLLYHYNRLLMKVFYPRIKANLGFIPSGRFKVIFSLFLSIFAGGVLFHYPRDSRPAYFHNGFWISLADYVSAFPYFFVLALFVCLTVHFRNKRYQPPFAWRVVRPVVYFTVFSLIYSLYMAGVHNRGSWLAYYNYLLNLLNLA